MENFVKGGKNVAKAYLDGIEGQKKSIGSITDSLINILHNLGVAEDKCNDVRATILDCLQTRTESNEEIEAKKLLEYEEIAQEAEQEEAEDTSHLDKENTPATIGEQRPEEINDEIETDENPEIVDGDKNIEKWCNNFKNKIEGISDVDDMVNILKCLIGMKLNSRDLATGREIVLDYLDYEIKILNLGNEDNKKKFGSYNTLAKKSNIDPETTYYETDEKGMEQISSRCSEGWKVATQADIQNILKALVKNHSLVSGKKGDIHDEDIAFFMLMTQTDGEILLKKDKLLGKNRVLKEYDDFRGFKDLRKNGTGQIILIRKK